MPLFFLLLVIINHNALAQSDISPYIAMHADDPVKWQPWNKKTILKAKRENKPLLLSLGYFSCYWCHVMQRENYKNEEVAALINKHFIPVVIDRELHPALDARLNAFVEELIGYAGWPLHVFMTPEGYPFLGAVYLPRPKFVQWITQVSSLWREQSDYLSGVAKDAALSSQFAQTLKLKPVNARLVKTIELAFLSAVHERWDEMEGGFGVENKFPLPVILETLLDIANRNKKPEIIEFIELTLDNIAYNGLRDPIDGGFFRYTSDPSWQIPHFEKMLYDNALLAKLYLKAGRLFNKPEYTDIGLQAIDFMINKMQVDQSGFASAFSAIGESGEEGEYYLWQKHELQKYLTPEEYALASTAWQLEKPPVVEGGYLPIGINKQTTMTLRPVLKKLENQRLKRHIERDEKIITSWNALALLAISEAAKIDEKYQKTGNQIANFLITQWDGQQLSRAVLNKKKIGHGTLEDYAYTALALNRWAGIKNNSVYSATSLEILQQAWKNFFTDHGWLSDATPVTAYNSTKAMISDGPLPSPSAILITATLEHAGSDNSETLKRNLATATGVGHELLKTSPFWYASQLSALSLTLE